MFIFVGNQVYILYMCVYIYIVYPYMQLSVFLLLDKQPVYQLINCSCNYLKRSLIDSIFETPKPDKVFITLHINKKFRTGKEGQIYQLLQFTLVRIFQFILTYIRLYLTLSHHICIQKIGQEGTNLNQNKSTHSVYKYIYVCIWHETSIFSKNQINRQL